MTTAPATEGLAAREAAGMEDAALLRSFWTLLRASRALALIMNRGGTILGSSSSWLTVLGRSESQMMGHPIADLLHPEDRPVPVPDATVAETLDGAEVRCVASDGGYRRLTWTTMASASMPYVFAIAQDVTELRRAQRLAEDARARAVAASKTKSRFLADMSHELRTPMSGVLGMLALALETELTSAQRELLEGAHESADHLLTILNDILDISKVEAGKLSLEIIPFALRATLEAAVAPLFHRARQKGLRANLVVAPCVPDSLLGDPTRFRQIVVNLIGNAIKFTAEGAISVQVHEEGPSLLHVAVSDTGVGIRAEALGRIFEPFEQAERSTTRSAGGTGLGLAICKELTALMDGRLCVESIPEHGSTFHFTARLPPSETAVDPALPAPSPDVAAMATAPRQGTRVLLAEDEPINAKVAKRTLEKLGCEVVLVSDGVAAVEMARTQDFDLALLDLRMPVLDGLGATAAIRALEQGSGRRLPIVALTANAMKEDIARCLQGGMDGHLSKPLQRAELSATLDAYGHPTSLLVRPSRPRARLPSVRIEVVRARCGHDRERLGQVAGACGDALRDGVGELECACDPWDAASIVLVADRLSEIFRQVAAEPAEKLLAEIVRAARAGEVTTTRDFVSRLRAASAEVEEELLAGTTSAVTTLPPAR